jgi:dihydroflavonol-4-reductase
MTYPMIAQSEQTALVLVTGATGFTGRHLVRALVADGQRVRAIVRSSSRARELPPAGVEIVEGDLGADPSWFRGRCRVFRRCTT